MPNTTVLQQKDYVRVPWRNGQGHTTEIAKQLNPSRDQPGEPEFIWRISIADVDVSGSFSDFSGYDRFIMLVDGRGMTLDFGENGTAVISRVYDSAVFLGGWSTECSLIDGPVRDFNFMAATGYAAGQCRVVRDAGPIEPMPAHPTGDTQGMTRLVHVFEGTLDITAADRSVAITAGDTLIVESPEDAAITFGAVAEPFAAVVIDIRLLAPVST